VSFDLLFWHDQVPSTPERAAGLYERLTDGQTGVVDNAPAVQDFVAEVLAMLGDLTEDVTKTYYIQKPNVAPDVSGVLDTLGPDDVQSA
jgi:hypothetical protein